MANQRDKNGIDLTGIEWAEKMKEICKNQNTPYFFKQIDKVKQIPDDLMIRQFPKF